MHAHNTFEQPEEVVESDYAGYQMNADATGLTISLPPNCVVELRVKKS